MRHVQTESKRHHYVPQFMLRGFAGPCGRLAVVRIRPRPYVQRDRHPRQVGFIERLNSWKLPDGRFDDELERVPLGRLDTFGAQSLRDLIEFANAIEPEGQLRLLDHGWEYRVPLALHTAGLMVRGPCFRERLDGQALPAWIKQMRSGLLREVNAGRAAKEDVQPLLRAFDRPGMVELEPPPNRHQATLVDLITTVAIALGSTHLVSVRRVGDALVTGSEPVVVFRDAQVIDGVSCGALLAEADPPVALWDERDVMLARVTELVAATAGLAWAADRHTVVLFSNPDVEAGAKLTFVFNELPSDVLSGILSLKVAGASTWIAGASGDRTLEVLASAASHD